MGSIKLLIWMIATVCILFFPATTSSKWHIQSHGDTVTTHDLVRIQYETLPYPTFDNEEMAYEKGHYKNNGETPAIIFQEQTLEKINHYLNRGSENFQ